jgi:A/G-specific adenine glycosylase
MDASALDTRKHEKPGAIAGTLLAWYDIHARGLAWRASPGGPLPDPYRVWLSEVMLQQTTTTAAGPYFARFIARWPNVEALAAADDASVMAAWAGLGYYARARNLLACARMVAARGGVFPDSEEELRKLPGLGAYTAAAVAAIAFGRRAVVVDANVERVAARLFAVAEPLPAARPRLRALAESMTPAARAGDYAQAVMDLGAVICRPRAPRCPLCPLAGVCDARAQGEPERYPLKAPRQPRPERKGRAFWIAREGAGGAEVWLVQREGKGMLGGMRALPDDAWSARADGQGAPPLAGEWLPGGRVHHVFTHFSLDLQVMVYSGGDCSRLHGQPGEWWPVNRIGEAGLPALFAKAAQLVAAGAGEVV